MQFLLYRQAVSDGSRGKLIAVSIGPSLDRVVRSLVQAVRQDILGRDGNAQEISVSGSEKSQSDAYQYLICGVYSTGGECFPVRYGVLERRETI